MSQHIRGINNLITRATMLTATLALMAALFACNKSEKAAAEKSVQKTFASPEDAAAALFDAAKSDDRNAVLALFGPDGNTVVFSGDAVKDKGSLQDFIAAYSQMHRWR
jgi:hypothetical protein